MAVGMDRKGGEIDKFLGLESPDLHPRMSLHASTWQDP
jgi:hypothetical protein